MNVDYVPLVKIDLVTFFLQKPLSGMHGQNHNTNLVVNKSYEIGIWLKEKYVVA